MKSKLTYFVSAILISLGTVLLILNISYFRDIETFTANGRTDLIVKIPFFARSAALLFYPFGLLIILLVNFTIARLTRNQNKSVWIFSVLGWAVGSALPWTDLILIIEFGTILSTIQGCVLVASGILISVLTIKQNK